MTVQQGETVPAFTAVQASGAPYAPAPGRWRVLFFFPKTTTTHCQLQARRYQRVYDQFQALGVDVVGINGDPRQDQLAFRDLCVLGYPLLDDGEQVLSTLFGVLGEPWPDETVRRPRRDTFLLDPDNVVVRHWRDVDPAQDADTVLAEVRQLRT
ncbi:peroxiredoxin Q/BCP [Deinococcus metalli]|uniref:thioredoxin-dependent peroxiredoxin n=1 Tax=Deinococcus metalli TaxID=1141878 RepID=A0A7W8KCZ5_9DEIO|nr:peroxiredoxin [Deinococcus metalli]MBB5374761.1 peroxiredoxin Q/BCP [Deinococcus metalli]GHF33913.1 peroxiredoxin [Deinococcus metalli]